MIRRPPRSRHCISSAASDVYKRQVEIEALTLVMEQYKEDTESSVELDIEDIKPSYMALRQDECNATVEVTEKTGLEVVNTESFDVNVCLKEIYKVIN